MHKPESKVRMNPVILTSKHEHWYELFTQCLDTRLNRKPAISAVHTAY